MDNLEACGCSCGNCAPAFMAIKMRVRIAELERERDAAMNEVGELGIVNEGLALKLAAALRELAELRERKDAAYEERNRVVALLARFYEGSRTKTAIEGWSDDWHGCVYFNTREGQVSWHFHDSQAFLFDGLPVRTIEWDGHTTEEKYARIERICAAIDAAREREKAGE